MSHTATAAPVIDRAAQDADLAARGYATLSDAHFIDYGLGAGRGVRRLFWGEARVATNDELLAIGAAIDPNGVWSREEYREEFGEDCPEEEILASFRGFFNDSEADEAAWSARQDAAGGNVQ